VTDRVAQIAEAMLYEGYLLWPYRRSVLKNQQRWTFGGVYPWQWSAYGGQGDPWQMQSEVLLEADRDATVALELRFLHVVDRRIALLSLEGQAWVDSLQVDGTRHASWQEATERAIVVPARPVSELSPTAARLDIGIDAGTRRDGIHGADGTAVGMVVREWRSLHGSIAATATRLAERVWRMRASLVNLTSFEGETRPDALRQTFVASHFVWRSDGGAFVSSTDPPAALREAAATCRNVGTWPALVGEEGERDTMLASPIILYDYPRLAPESPQNLFDSTEIDQLLVLNVLSLTDEEQREIRESDPRGRALLERCASLPPADLMRLHGAIRDVRPIEGP
jgi:hypothetical protein